MSANESSLFAIATNCVIMFCDIMSIDACALKRAILLLHLVYRCPIHNVVRFYSPFELPTSVQNARLRLLRLLLACDS